MDIIKDSQKLGIPENLVIFISGVPGTGKTSISYELLKHYDEFRVIQETDLIREILRGYNEYLESVINDEYLIQKIHTNVSIPNHMKIFTYEEIKEQCLIMKRSIEKIVKRQQRKGIPSIINGVHIVPEILNGIVQNKNIIFINLYIREKEILRSRLSTRSLEKYMPYLDVSFRTNCALYNSVSALSQESPDIFRNIDVTYLSLHEATATAIDFIKCV